MTSDRRPVLSRGVHDRLGLRRKDEAHLADLTARAQVLVLTAKHEAPIVESDQGPRLQWRPRSTVDTERDLHLLGEFDGTAYMMLRGDRDLRADQWADLREIGALLPEIDAGLLVQAVALAAWHDRHPFCPVCGRPTTVTHAGWVRSCAEGHEQFPRTDPAVIMLVHDGGDRCVLGRQAVWPPGRFSILAGFVEPGESAEMAVAREVAEEVGLTVTDVRYVDSQPWPFPGSLMLGFTARVSGDTVLHIDHDEIEEARWFSRAELAGEEGPRALPPPVSIAHRIITDWVSGVLVG